MREITRFDRIRGALYGVAVGDALGGPLEFMSKAEIEKKHGKVRDMIGGGWLNLKPGETTDDTAMTLAVAEGILENPENPIPAIGQRFISWYKSGPKDIGNTCAHAIRTAMRADDTAPTCNEWIKAGITIQKISKGRNAGNGALMRTVYPALYYPDKEEAVKIAQDIGFMTHYNDTSAIVIDLYVRFINGIISGPFDMNIYKAYEVMRKPDAPTGYVIDSMYYAMEAIDIYNTFEHSLIWVVNQGGDADTIGAITGGIAGALYGYSAIPERWINALDDSIINKLDYLAAKASEQWDKREIAAGEKHIY